jgi:hypothetical protein
MKLVILAFHTLKDGTELKPGEVYDGFDDAEAARQIKIGGARLQTPEEIEAEEAAADAKAAEDEKSAEGKAADAKAAALAAVNAATRRK